MNGPNRIRDSTGKCHITGLFRKTPSHKLLSRTQ